MRPIGGEGRDGHRGRVRRPRRAEPVVQGLVVGAVIAGLNLLGAVLVLVYPDPSDRLLDGALGFAAGGMLFVISDDIIPETHVRGRERAATAWTMLGVVVMLFLDVSLG